ncbi:MAG: DUF92 domain-containing protein [Planctomycetes bacterium]|nr:DUF92 domain-containing protein [Planctomycetota bacterium]
MPSPEKSASAPPPSEPAAPAVSAAEPSGIRHRPGLRSLIHLGALTLAFPLTWIASNPKVETLGLKLSVSYGWVWAATIMLGGVLINTLLLPRTAIGKSILRDEDRPVFWGGLLYPLSIAIAFILYPPFAVAAAWAALAFGDAAAVTLGSRAPSPKLPWNPKKSWAGLVAFVVAAIPACTLLLWWCPSPLFITKAGNPEWPYVWTLAVLAAVSGAIFESLEGPFDDNFRVPLGTGLVVWLAALFLNFGTSGLPQERAFQPEWLLHALVVNGVLVLVVWFMGFADLPGSLAGGVIGAVVYFFALPPGYALLILFVVCGSLLSKLGRKTKEARGAAEARQGKRGLSNVVANLIVPAACCLAYPASKVHPALLLAFAGALAAAFADTASSEIGALSSQQPVLITTRKPVAHGTNGAVTRLGFLAAAGACVLLAIVAWAGGFWSIVRYSHEWNVPSAGVAHGLLYSSIVLAAGLAGTCVDSYLGATVEDLLPGFGKGVVNFVCTLTGAAVAGIIGLFMAT